MTFLAFKYASPLLPTKTYFSKFCRYKPGQNQRFQATSYRQYFDFNDFVGIRFMLRAFSKQFHTDKNGKTRLLSVSSARQSTSQAHFIPTKLRFPAFCRLVSQNNKEQGPPKRTPACSTSKQLLAFFYLLSLASRAAFWSS